LLLDSVYKILALEAFLLFLETSMGKKYFSDILSSLIESLGIQINNLDEENIQEILKNLQNIKENENYDLNSLIDLIKKESNESIINIISSSELGKYINLLKLIRQSLPRDES